MVTADNMPRPAKTQCRKISRLILSWYARHKRDLPWRKTTDPYRVWVSEIMLQQTQVETVIPYYHNFLTSFPTVHALADASLDDVLKAWENLGYYARARHMHAAARQIAQKFDGAFPQTVKDLIGLPGIGEYTAAAVLSIAFGLPCAAVDANIRRVVSRLFAVQVPLDKSHGKNIVRTLAEDLLPQEAPGDFNQAMMDLGATLCLPKQPKCHDCPTKGVCESLLKGIQGTVPVLKKRTPIPHHHMTAGIMTDKRGRVLIVQRPHHGLLGGLWKLPGGKKSGKESLTATLRRTIEDELGLDVQVKKEKIAAVNHVYTHFRITLHAYGVIRKGGKPKALSCQDWRWSSPARLNDFAFSKADRKILEAIDNKGLT